MTKLVVGIDFGTDSVRAIAVDAGTGATQGSAVRAYPRWAAGKYSDPSESRFRQHPLDYLECLEAVVPELMGQVDSEAVVGLGIDTTACTMAPADRSGTPLALRPDFADDPNAMFVLWKDHTAAAEARQITEVARNSACDYTEGYGHAYSAECYFSKALHLLSASPRVRKAAYTFLDLADWLTALLTGCTDPLKMHWNLGSAGHKALWNRRWGGLPPEEFFQNVSPLLAGLRQRCCPDGQVVLTERPAGTLSPEWAARLHLPAAAILSTGMMDGLAGFIGCGIRPGRTARLMGTSASDLAVTPLLKNYLPGVSSQVDESLWPGMTSVELGQSAVGDIFAWFRRFLCYGGEVSWERLNTDAAQVPPGAAGTTALDWFNGRRCPDSNQLVRGALAGLTLGTTPPMLFRALIEATAFGYRRNFELLRKFAISVNEIVAAGGIARKSPLVMQICADVVNMSIGIIEADEISALGAAVYAAVAAGIYPDLAAATDALAGKCSKVYRPNPENARCYDAIYQNYLYLAQCVDRGTAEGKFRPRNF